MLSSLLTTISSRVSRQPVFWNGIQRFCANVTGPVIGIDLGTTNSCVAVMEGQEPRVISNAEGARTTPSVVAFTENTDVLVGETAKRQAVSNSKNTVYGTKRLIGRRFRDKEVQNEAKHLPFALVEADNGDCWVEARNKRYSPSQIGAYVLTKMKDTASSYLGTKVKNAVVTVPAYFNDSQRQATKDAGVIAGLNVVRIINEPTAAALAYGLNKKNLNKTIAVYDLGGGTFDISILEINDGVFEVKSTNGDTRLGGEDFDNILIKYLIDDVNKKMRCDVKQDLKALQRIKEAAEKAKIELSFATETEIQLPYLYKENSYVATMKRAQLESLVGDLVQRTIAPCKMALGDAGIDVSKLQEVLLVGGMTRMPKVQEVVREFFKREPSKSVNPDEAVAMGAAVQGGVLVGSVSDIVLIDVTPLSLGVKTKGDIMSVVVPRNTSIPTSKSETYTTNEDNQTSVAISVYQGERQMCADNLNLGEFILGPIPPRPKGHSHIEVKFELDSNGIVKVTALDKMSSVKADAVIKSNPRGLSKDQLKDMVSSAEQEREKDITKKTIAEAKNEADSVLYSCKRFITDNGGKLPEDDMNLFSNKTAKFEVDAVNSTSMGPAEIRKATNAMSQELTVMHQRVRDSTPTDNQASSRNTDETSTTGTNTGTGTTSQ